MLTISLQCRRKKSKKSILLITILTNFLKSNALRAKNPLNRHNGILPDLGKFYETRKISKLRSNFEEEKQACAKPSQTRRQAKLCFDERSTWVWSPALL